VKTRGGQQFAEGSQVDFSELIDGECPPQRKKLHVARRTPRRRGGIGEHAKRAGMPTKMRHRLHPNSAMAVLTGMETPNDRIRRRRAT